MCLCLRVCVVYHFVLSWRLTHSALYLQFQFCVGVKEEHRLKMFENVVMGGAAVTDCAHRGG